MAWGQRHVRFSDREGLRQNMASLSDKAGRGRGLVATEDWEDVGGDLANMDFESQNLNLYEDEDDWED